MRRKDAMVDLEVKEVLGADRRGIFLHDLVGGAAQRQPPHLAGLFNDLCEAWGHAHDLLNSFECSDPQAL